MASKREVAETTVRALDQAAQAIERFCVEAEPGTDSGFELDSLERVVMSIAKSCAQSPGFRQHSMSAPSTPCRAYRSHE
jgi:hypothetical protein